MSEAQRSEREELVPTYDYDPDEMAQVIYDATYQAAWGECVRAAYAVDRWLRSR